MNHRPGDPQMAVTGSGANPSLPSAGRATVAARVTRLCMLEYALGRVQECRRSSCPFWEPGGAVLEFGCLLERFLPAEDWTPELAAHWLRVRSAAEPRSDRESGLRPLSFRLGDS